MNNENEIWVPLMGFEKRYEVSNLGRVRNIRTNKVLKKFKSDRQYFNLSILDNDKKKKTIKVGKYVWESFNNCKCKETVDHIDRNKNNNELSNLRCITNAENAKNKGKQKRHNLSADLKREIMMRYNSGEWSVYKVWKLFGIPTNYLYTTIKRGSWNKYVDNP